jgi:hypothetical protein
LIPGSDAYSLSDLIALQAIVKQRDKRVAVY